MCLAYQWAWGSLLLVVEVSFKCVETTTPELAVGLEPSVDLDQRLGIELVPAPLGVASNPNQTGVAEHSQVLGDAGLAEREAVDQLADRTLPLTKQVQDLPTRWLGHQLERSRHRVIHYQIAI
jgi:hypothetical protein